jgi:hypothetical protein
LSTIAAGAAAAGTAAAAIAVSATIPFRFVPKWLPKKEEAGGAAFLSAGTALAKKEDLILLRPEYNINDNGGLAGQPVDLILERSRTPASTYPGGGGGLAPPLS